MQHKKKGIEILASTGHKPIKLQNVSNSESYHIIINLTYQQQIEKKNLSSEVKTIPNINSIKAKIIINL